MANAPRKRGARPAPINAGPSAGNQEPAAPAVAATLSPDNKAVLEQLASLIRLAQGFRLGLVKCNQPAQRRLLVAHLRQMLAGEAESSAFIGVEVREVELTEPVRSLREAVRGVVGGEKLAADGKLKAPHLSEAPLLVHGFEHSVPSQGLAPALAELNFSRDLFPRDFPHPFILWLPDYAMTRLAREAPDFWSWRSGVFEFAPEREVMAAVIEMAAHGPRTSSLTLTEKRERIALLEGLLRDYEELDRGEREEQVRGDVLHRLGRVHHELGEHQEARRLYQESLDISRTLGNQQGIGASLHNLGMLAQDQGHYAEARRLYQETLEIFRKLGDQQGVGNSLHNLGVLAQRQGDYAEARRRYQESLDIKRKLGDQRGTGASLHQLGMLAQDQGDYAEARRRYRESLGIERKLGNQQGIGNSLHNLGILAQHQGDYAEARRLYQESLEIARKLGNQQGIGASLHNLGALAQHQGDYAEARRLHQEALEVARKLGNQQGIGASLHQLGRLAQDQGDYAEARRLYRESLDIQHKLGNQQGIANSLHNLGMLAQEEGDHNNAVRLWLSAHQIFERLGSPSKEIVARQMARLRQKLGEEEFGRVMEAAAAEGREAEDSPGPFDFQPRRPVPPVRGELVEP